MGGSKQVAVRRQDAESNGSEHACNFPACGCGAIYKSRRDSASPFDSMPERPSCAVCEARGCSAFMCVETRHYWRCNSCFATFLSPLQLPARSVEDAQYRLHRNDVSDVNYRAFLSRLAAPLLARLPAGLSGLDYGCGPGPALATMLVEAGHRMAVYDPLFFDITGVLNVHYDFITCTEVVEHFHHPADEFSRLNGMLKPGGWLAIMTTFQNDDAAFSQWHYRRDPTHVVFYREATFRVIAKRHNWQCDFPGNNLVLLRKAD